MGMITTTAPAAVEILAPCLTATLSCGETVSGRLEYFRKSKALALFGEDGLATVLLTVPAAEAPAEHDALEPDEVLLRNWTGLRGMAAALVQLGLVELTGQEVRVGMFRLEALVARVL